MEDCKGETKIPCIRSRRKKVTSSHYIGLGHSEEERQGAVLEPVIV